MIITVVNERWSVFCGGRSVSDETVSRIPSGWVIVLLLSGLPVKKERVGVISSTHPSELYPSKEPLSRPKNGSARVPSSLPAEWPFSFPPPGMAHFRHNAIRRDETARQRIVEMGAIIIQVEAAFEALAGRMRRRSVASAPVLVMIEP